MQFPNARKGVKNLFTAEILILITTILSTVALLFTVVSGASAEGTDDGALGAISVALLICGLSAAVLVIIALILDIIGVVRCSKDEDYFKGVIFVYIFGAVAVVGITVANAVIGTQNSMLDSISQVISDIIKVISTILIIIGICSIANQMADDTVLRKGQILFRVIFWIALLSIIMRAVAYIIPGTAASVTELALLLLSGVLNIVQYFMYLSFLKKASKMLAD